MSTMKVTTETRLKAVEAYLSGEYSLRQIGAQYHVHHSSIEKWVYLYKMYGLEGLQKRMRYQKYSKTTREKVVAAYLSGGHTLYGLCQEYGIRSIAMIQYWVRRELQLRQKTQDPIQIDHEN